MKWLKAKKRVKLAEKLSRTNAMVFAVIFAGVGAYVVVKSFAATTPTTCTTTVNSADAARTAVSNAADGDVVCMQAGSYGRVTLTRSGTHANNVILMPDPTLDPNGSGKVTLNGLTVDINSNHITVKNFYITGGVRVEYGNSYITLDHNDVYTNGVLASSSDYTVPGAPNGSGSSPKITNLTISNNKIHHLGGALGEDAIQIKNFSYVNVTGNEIYDIVQQQDTTDGTNPHSDCLQTVFGGDHLTFDHNYLHDNRCQNFFISDGRVTDVTVTNNLMIRNDMPTPTPGSGQPGTFNVTYVSGTLDIHNNTIATGQALNFTGCTGWQNIQINHNVMSRIASDSSSCVSPVLVEDYDDLPTNDIGASGTHTVQSQPVYIDGSDSTATDGMSADPYAGDWRLAGQLTKGGVTYSAGIDWRARDYIYGPTNTSGSGSGGSSDSTPPTVSVTSPTAGSTVSGSGVTFTANASDDVGVVGVQFKVDGNNVGSEDTSAPYSVVWDTRTATNGSHTITAVARDAAGNYTTSTGITVTTNNSSTCLVSSISWQNTSFASQTGSFTFSFDATPSANNIDSVTGLSNGAAADFTNLAAIVRFSDTGVIDARNGANYSALNPLSYVAGTSYHFVMTVNVTSHTYDVTVTPSGGSATTIASNYAFRTEQASVSSLNNWATNSVAGTHTVCGATVGSATTPSTKIGDFNGDNSVNGFDLNIFFQAWKSTAKPPQDFNQDGSVNGFDLAVFLAQYGT